MAWIESHQALAGHPKVARLARQLKCNKAQAIGHLHLLWWWTLDYAPAGCLSAFTPAEIADAAEWSGSVELFSQALRDSGFIDGHQVHDWEHYAGRILNARASNRERQRRFRERAGETVTRDVTVTSQLRNGLPNPTQPNPTNKASTRVGTRAESGVSDDENEFMLLCKVVFPKDEMAANGGLWRNRYRDKPAKAWRVLNDTAETIKNRPTEIKGTVGAFATDLWKRFA